MENANQIEFAGYTNDGSEHDVNENLVVESTNDSASETKDESIAENAHPEAKQEEVKQEVAKTATEEKPTEKEIEDYFKAKGFSDEEKAYAELVIDALKANKLEEFLSVTKMDYDKMPVEQVYRLSIEKEYPHASEEEIDLLLQTELEKKYGITGDDDAKDERGLKLLELQMRKVREAFKAEQSQYKVPKFEQKSSAIDESAIAEQRKQFEEYINSEPVFAELDRSKVLKFGEGDNAFNFKLDDTAFVKQQTMDVSSFISQFDKPDGTIEAQKWAKQVAFAKHGDAIIAEAIAYGRSLGAQKKDAELVNAAPVYNSSPTSKMGEINIEYIGG